MLIRSSNSILWARVNRQGRQRPAASVDSVESARSELESSGSGSLLLRPAPPVPPPACHVCNDTSHGGVFSSFSSVLYGFGFSYASGPFFMFLRTMVVAVLVAPSSSVCVSRFYCGLVLGRVVVRYHFLETRLFRGLELSLGFFGRLARDSAAAFLREDCFLAFF